MGGAGAAGSWREITSAATSSFAEAGRMARYQLPSWIQVAPQQEQEACDLEFKTIVTDVLSQTGHRTTRCSFPGRGEAYSARTFQHKSLRTIRSSRARYPASLTTQAEPSPIRLGDLPGARKRSHTVGQRRAHKPVAFPGDCFDQRGVTEGFP